MNHNHYRIKQKLTVLANKYQIWLADEKGEPQGSPILEVNQKRLKIKEEILFKNAQGETEMSIKARKVFEMAGQYDLSNSDGTLLATFKKVFGASLLRSTWHILDKEGNLIATAQERSRIVAAWRRFCGLVPVAGEVLALIPVPFHFDILSPEGKLMGKYTRTFGKLRDTYHLDLSDDLDHRLNRKAILGFAIALDALQGR